MGQQLIRVFTLQPERQAKVVVDGGSLLGVTTNLEGRGVTVYFCIYSKR